MSKNSIDKTFAKARSLEHKGEIDKARNIYQSILESFPKNKRAKESLYKINQQSTKISPSNNPDQQKINHLMELYKQQNLTELIKDTDKLKNEFPYSFILFNIRAMAFAGKCQKQKLISEVL